ncbi:MAG: class I SAM-dependent methyltransferase [bacterium]|jgi:predicted methyltransferase
MSLEKPLHYGKSLIKDVLHYGDLAVDATAGNGHDTVFLAKAVGPGGRVWAFDIQAQALEQVRLRLEKESLLHHHVTLLQVGHEKMAVHVPAGVGAIMFNLGYLPGGDHNIITRPETTLTAVNAGLGLLRRGGIMTLIVYPGHQGGREEGLLLEEFLLQLPQENYQVLKYCFLNQRNQPPYLLAVYKLS